MRRRVFFYNIKSHIQKQESTENNDWRNSGGPPPRHVTTSLQVLKSSFHSRILDLGVWRAKIYHQVAKIEGQKWATVDRDLWRWGGVYGLGRGWRFSPTTRTFNLHEMVSDRFDRTESYTNMKTFKKWMMKISLKLSTQVLFICKMINCFWQRGTRWIVDM